MKIRLLTVCVCLALASASFGQIDPDANSIGFYADMGATMNSIQTEEGMIELYLLVTGLDAPAGIAAWEMSLFYDGPVVNVGYLIPYNSINVGVFPSYSVGNAQAILPQNDVIHLMTMTFLVTGLTPANIYIKQAHLPVGGSLGNDLPVYVDGEDWDVMRNLYPSSGSIDLPVFRINGEAPVATQPASFSGVKALFR